MSEDGTEPVRIKGRFAPGRSGNPAGGARRARSDAAPPGGRPSRHDADWVNFFTGQGVLGRDKRLGAHFNVTPLSFDQLMHLWLGDDLAARAVEMIPKEALRQGYDVTVADSQEGTDEDTDGLDPSEASAEITDELERLGANDAIEIAGSYERGYGGGAILIGANDGQADLTQPLNLKAVRSLDFLNPLEARECMPIYAYGDPRAPKYGEPEIYRIITRSVLPSRQGFSAQTMEIHESRLLIFPGIRVSRFQPLAARAGWGEAVLTRIYRVLRDFNAAYANTGVLINDFSQAVVKIAGLWEALAQDAGAFNQRLQAMEAGRSTVNAIAIDAGDSYERQQTPVTGLSDLLERFGVRLAAACDMPLTLLFGTSPAGLNATGESDIRSFYDRVASYQQRKILPKLRQICQILFRTIGSRSEPVNWSIKFRPLWQESAKDQASAAAALAQADTAWTTASILSSDEIAKARWGKGQEFAGITVDFSAREAQDDLGSQPGDQEVVTLPGTGGAAGTEVAAQAFNGAQISSMLEIVKAATARQIPMGSATAIIQTAFNLSPDKAKAITSSVAAAPLPPAVGATEPDEPDEDPEPEGPAPTPDETDGPAPKAGEARGDSTPPPRCEACGLEIDRDAADSACVLCGKEYIPPPPSGSARPQPDVVPPGPPAAPDPNTPPVRMITAEDRADACARPGAQRLDFDPDQPRAPDGKWGSGGSGTDPGRAPDDRTAAAVRDPAFTAPNRERLIAAGDRVRANYPRDQRATDAVHEEAQKEIRAEAGRILREQAVVGSDPRMQAELERVRGDMPVARVGDESAKQHDVLMERVTERRAELAQHDEARAAGLVPKVPDEALKAYQTAAAQHTPALDAAHAEVDAASQKALDALGKYSARAGDEERDALFEGDKAPGDAEELAASYAHAADRLGGKGDVDESGDFRDAPPSQDRYREMVDPERHAPPADVEIPDHFRDEETGELKSKWEPDPSWEPDHVTHEEAQKLNFEEHEEGERAKTGPWDPDRFAYEQGHLDPDNLLGDPDKHGHVSADFDPSDYDESFGHTAEKHAALVATWNAAADADRTEYERIADKWKAEEKAHDAADKAAFERVQKAVAAHADARRQAADDAQAALEDLHGKQTAALATAKTIDRAVAKPLAAAKTEVGEEDFSPSDHAHDRIAEHPALATATPADEDDDERVFASEPHERLYQGAQGAFGEDVQTARSTREVLGQRHGAQTQGALEEARDHTAALVRALSQVSGRAPALAKPSRKKPR